MKKKDYLSAAGFVLIIIIAAWRGGFWGGFIAGAFSAIMLFTSVGKVVFRKTEKRIDAAIRLKRMMDDH